MLVTNYKLSVMCIFEWAIREVIYVPVEYKRKNSHCINEG